MFFFTIQPAINQDYYCYQQITDASGLSQSIVNCILQDRDGLIWIGTQNGLNLYDGNHFTHILNQVADSTSLSDNYVLSICEDMDGFIWIGTMSGGLNKLNKQTGLFTVYSYHKNDTTGISSNTIWKVAVDSLNNIWAETKKGINVLNTKTNRFKHYRFNENDTTTISSDMVVSIFVDNAGEVWCGTLLGPVKYNRPGDDFHRFNHFHPEPNYKNPRIWAITQNTFGNILLGSNKGIWELDVNDENKFNCICENDNFSTIWSLLPVNGKIWTGTNKGLLVFDYTDKSCRKATNSFLTPEHQEGNVWAVIKDNAGIIWAGSDNGIYKFRPQKGNFKTIKSNTDKPLHLSNNSVNSVLVDKDNTLWIGTDGGGLNMLEKDSKQFVVFTKSKLEQNCISGNNVWALIQDKEGIIWIGTYGAGLSSYNKKTGQFINYKVGRNDAKALSNTRVLALIEDSDGNIWIGTRGGGLNMFNKKTGNFKHFLHNPDDSTGIASNTVLSLIEDSQGNIVIGTFEGGLSIFNKKKNSFRNFKNNPSNPESLSNNNVWGLMFDSNNRLWLGTQGGLNFADYSVSNLKFRHFETTDGLPGNFIFGLEDDLHGNIWMSTFKGMARLNAGVFTEIVNNNSDLSTYKSNPFDPLFTNFDESDGISGNEFNQGAYFKSDDGTIYFGGMTGLTYFHPDSVHVNQFEPNVILSGFKIFNKDVGTIPADFEGQPAAGEVVYYKGQYFVPEKISYLEELILTYRESVFSFGFASLDFTMPEKNRYAYKMENFEHDWNFVSGQNQATYTNLDAGEYVFRVKGTNSDGKWSTNEVKLKITIVPPFWDTAWFKTVVLLTLIIFTFLILKRIIRVQKEKTIAEKEKMELQLKTIKNQIDPHFAFNAMNMIGSLVYKGDPDTVYDYFTRFANLIRTTLQDSEKIARPLEEEIEFVKNYIEIQKVRFKDKFNFTLNIDKSTDLKTEMPKMIIQTFAENAIKHGLMHKKGKGQLLINIEQDNDKLKITVEDNGIGREKAAKLSKGSTGKGMQIIGQIFEMYNKLFDYEINMQIVDLKDKNGKASGTRVVITISKV